MRGLFAAHVFLMPPAEARIHVGGGFHDQSVTGGIKMKPARGGLRSLLGSA